MNVGDHVVWVGISDNEPAQIIHIHTTDRGDWYWCQHGDLMVTQFAAYLTVVETDVTP